MVGLERYAANRCVADGGIQGLGRTVLGTAVQRLDVRSIMTSICPVVQREDSPGALRVAQCWL